MDFFLKSLSLFVVIYLCSSNIKAQSISSVTPNKARIGNTLDVFISGQNVNFLQGSSSIQTAFNQTNTSIVAPTVSVNSAGNILNVSLDLSNHSYPTGFYNLSVNTPANGILTLNNAFEIDSTVLREMLPNEAIFGQIKNFLITGEGIDLRTVTIPPQLSFANNTINTTIIGSRGKDTLEIQADFTSGGLIAGNYSLTLFAPNDTLFLNSALQLTSKGIAGVSPNKGQIGETLNVFISGQNVNFLNGSSTIPNMTTELRRYLNGVPKLIPAPTVGANASGTVAEVSLDLTDPTLTTGSYELLIRSTYFGNLSLSNAFEIDSKVLRKLSPENTFLGRVVDFDLIAEGINLNTVTTPPQFSNGTNTFSSTIIGTGGNDTLKVRVDFTTGGWTLGFFDLSLFIPGDTLHLKNALQLFPAQNLTSISPNKGKLGDILNVFISGQNVDFSNGSTTIQTSLTQGSVSIPTTYLSAPDVDTLQVLLDLSNTSYPPGFYDLSVTTLTNGQLILNNAFEIDSAGLTNATPSQAFIGQTFNVLVTGQNVDLSLVTMSPQYVGIGGGSTINTSIVGLKGDSLELMINLSSGSFVPGNYDLIVNLSGTILTLRNALTLQTTNISGTVFYDLNSNAVQDIGELGINSVQLELLPNNNTSSTNTDGKFSFSNLSNGSYQVVISPLSTTFVTNPSDTQTVVINTPGSYNASFGINTSTPSTLNNTSIILYSGRARCFGNVSYTAIVRNNGFVSSNGVFKVIKNQNITFDSSSITQADSINGDTIFFSYPTLLPGEQFMRQIQCSLPGITILPVGSILNAAAEVIQLDNLGVPIAGSTQNDIDATVIRCSFDPNDKLVTPIGSGPLGYVLHNTPLEYTIRFQNTGNDTAYRVQVIDTLSSFLDYNSFEFLTATHPVSVVLNPNGELTFTFNDIFLVDSATNEPASNGLVKFKISPNLGLVDSTVVLNKGAIYFDFNPPVITNEVRNTYVTTIVSIEEQKEKIIAAKIFPNPNNGIFNVLVSESLIDARFVIYNLKGQVIYVQDHVKGVNIEVNLEKHHKGIFFIQISDDDHLVNSKLIMH